MGLPGLKSLVQSGRWLRSRFAPGGLILGYHRVVEPGASADGMCVSPAHFAEHLEVIRRHAHPLSLSELVAGLDEGHLPPGSVALTFDDGYADVLDRAMPWLERHAVPATVFVVTGALGQTFWWDEVAHLHESTDAKRTDLASGSTNTGRCLAAEEVRRLADGRVEIGAHTVNHPRLADEPIEVQRAEIVDSKRALEALLGLPVIAFSYPNGSASPTTRALVQEAGFRHACGSQPDVARRTSHRYQLPRFWVPDCDGDAFASWLHGWLLG